MLHCKFNFGSFVYRRVLPVVNTVQPGQHAGPGLGQLAVAGQPAEYSAGGPELQLGLPDGDNSGPAGDRL